jgi:hypothetical protein
VYNGDDAGKFEIVIFYQMLELTARESRAGLFTIVCSNLRQRQLATLLLPWVISRAARWLRAWIQSQLSATLMRLRKPIRK